MMTNTRSESMDWALWFYWIMATTIGWLAGNIFFSFFPVIVSGIAVSALQGVVMYGRIYKAWRWAVFSSLAWVIGYTLHIIIFSSSLGAFVGLLIGGVVGIVQWSILHREVDWSGWWIIISILAWTTGLTTMPGLLTSGTLPGALTGLTLVILFRYSSPRRKTDKKT